eukprot:1160545-Pelagomonas_calceolata.AAC.22
MSADCNPQEKSSKKSSKEKARSPSPGSEDKSSGACCVPNKRHMSLFSLIISEHTSARKNLRSIGCPDGSSTGVSMTAEPRACFLSPHLCYSCLGYPR